MNLCSSSRAAKGRPREFDTDVALAAALSVFWRRGYEAASMAELTAEMGITKPSLYAAFGNKESLFRKALDLYEREKLAYVRAALDATSSRGVAERLLDGALALHGAEGEPKGCLGTIGTMACSAEGESVREEVIARQAAVHRELVVRFDRAKAEGDLPDHVDPEALARYLKALLQGLSVQAGAGASGVELRTLRDMALAVWPGR